VWIGGDLVGNGEDPFDIKNFHRLRLSEQNRETDIWKSLAVNKLDQKLHELRIWETVDLDALK
jgi:hypothetical protein